MSLDYYKKELILNKNFKEYICEYCEFFGYHKSLATRINSSLESYHYIDNDTKVIDFISNHDRFDINRTINFRRMGEKCYSVLLGAIKTIDVPIKGEPGFKHLIANYNNFTKGDNKEEELSSLEEEFYVLKKQLKKNQEVLTELIETNKVLDEKINLLISKVGDLDGKKYR